MMHLKIAGTPGEIAESWKAYSRYLEGVKTSLPREAYEFAIADWHYDPRDHRSLHDSWLESLTIIEEPPPDAPEQRRLGITIRLLAPFHDGHTFLTYSDVRSYRLQLSGLTPSHPSKDPWVRGHGDWLIDEIRLTPEGDVVHQIQLDSGAEWEIVCKNVRHTTTVQTQ